MCVGYAAFGIVGTMPNPGICRIEILKRSGNSVNPADAPSCYWAPCGIVRSASQAMEEAQHLPSGRLTIFPFLWSPSSAPQPTASARLVSRPVKNGRRRMSLDESPHGSVRYFDLRLAPDYAESRRCGEAPAAAMARSFGIFQNSA